MVSYHFQQKQQLQKFYSIIMLHSFNNHFHLKILQISLNTFLEKAIIIAIYVIIPVIVPTII